MKPLRVGIIGYGYWGPNLTRNFSELAGSDLIAIADLNEERLKQALLKYPQITVETGISETLQAGFWMPLLLRLPRRLIIELPKIAWNTTCMCLSKNR
jgi:hypothetical protein